MADHPDRPGYSFTPGPPPEASRFLRNKAITPSFNWQDVEPEEHAVAFTVAKGMQADVLTTIRDALQVAIDEGKPFAEFQRGLRPQLQRLGWWGRREMVDPITGVAEEVQLGSPRRLRTIYRANLRTARAAGQWERIQRTSDALPYLEYRLGPSERHRPHHEAKSGMVLPADDPFWSSWYPPNGWGCKCWVRQLSTRQAERRGVSDSPDVPMVEVRNKRTGEIKRVPAGIDPGWETNPGAVRHRRMDELLEEKLNGIDPQIARVLARDMATSWRAERVLAGSSGGAVPVAMLPGSIVDAIGARTAVVRMNDEFGLKIANRGREVSTETLLVLDGALHDGRLALETVEGAESLHVQSRGDAPWHFVLKHLREAGEIWVQALQRARPDKWRTLIGRASVSVLRE